MAWRNHLEEHSSASLASTNDRSAALRVTAMTHLGSVSVSNGFVSRIRRSVTGCKTVNSTQDCVTIEDDLPALIHTDS